MSTSEVFVYQEWSIVREPVFHREERIDTSTRAPSTVGARLQEQRLYRRLSIDDMATLVGVAPEAIHACEAHSTTTPEIEAWLSGCDE